MLSPMAASSLSSLRYVTAFDYRTRNPRWVLEHVTAPDGSNPGDGDRWVGCHQQGLITEFKIHTLLLEKICCFVSMMA
jgi:hypothetical protein